MRWVAGAVLLVAVAGCGGASSGGLSSSAGPDSQGNLPGCGRVRPVIAQSLHDIQDHSAGRTSADTAAHRLIADGNTLADLSAQAANPRLKNSIRGVTLQVRVYGATLHLHPNASISGTGKRFLRPFNQLAALCANGNF